MRPTWTVKLEGGPRRVNHSAVWIGHRIYMFGGYCSGENYETPMGIDIYAFNTVSYCWTKLQQKQSFDVNRIHLVPYMRYGHSSVAIDEKAYLFGGRNDVLGVCKTLFYFDTKNLKWVVPEVRGNLPGARDGHAMCVARGNIYICGGFEAECERFSEDTFMLDMKTMIWELLVTKGHVGMWRDFHTLTSFGNKLFLFGGRGDKFGPFSSNQEIYDNGVKVLDLDSLAWSSPDKPNQKAPIGRRSHTAFFHGNCLYIFGGYNSLIDEHFNDLWKFDPETGLWSEMTQSGNKPCPRRRHCSCYQDKKMFLFGGTSPPIPQSPNSTALFDHSDTYMLDFEPSLKTLCLLAVIKNDLDTSLLPPDLIAAISAMTKDNCITGPWMSIRG